MQVKYLGARGSRMPSPPPTGVGRGGLSSVTLQCLERLVPLISGEHMVLLMLSTDLSLHAGKRWASVC